MSTSSASIPLLRSLCAVVVFSSMWTAPAQDAAEETVAHPPIAVGAGADASDPFAVDEEDLFLLREPETAEEFFRGAVQAQRLGRPNLARLYLRRFLELNPDDATLLGLRDQYGPAAFARLANQRELQPLSTQLADRVAEVFRERGASPERIEALIQALRGTPEEAFPAREALINAGDAVIPELLVSLTSESDDYLRQQLLDILVAMGEPALPALHAALDAPEGSLRVLVLTAIGRIGSPRSVPHLYFPAYGREQPVAVRSAARRALSQIARVSRVAADVVEPPDVAAQLRKSAVASLREPAPIADETAAPVAGIRVWSWDPARNTVHSAVLSPREAALFRGTRFARETFLIAPEQLESQGLYLSFLLGSEAVREGVSEPPSGPGTAMNLALTAGPDAALEILGQALRYEIPEAAIGALSVLSQTARPGLLFSGEDVLAEALSAPHPQVQLAAAVAVLRLNPDRSFRHASRVVEVLVRALSDAPQPTAVIIDPNFPRGSTIAGFARDMGYDALLASTGQEGFRVASERTSPAFVLVNLNVSRWPLSQTLSNFRADARTRAVPLIVYGPAEGEWQVQANESGRYAYFRGPGIRDPRGQVSERLADVPGTAFVHETATTAAFAAQLRPALATIMPAAVQSDEERIRARAVAAFWLAQIADAGRTDLFPIASAEPALVAALTDPALAGNALIALSAIPTASAQSALAGFVLSPTTDGGLQATAAEDMADHVRRHGVLIDRRTVAQLNALWEAAKDPKLKTALATWSGALQVGSSVTRERLESIPPPVLPAAP